MPQPDPTPLPEPIETFFETIGEKGPVPSEVKEKLNARLPSLKGQAFEQCRRDHEDQAGCIASSLKTHAVDYDLFDFAARKTLLEAISQDCDNNAGVCLSVNTVLEKCRISSAAALPGKKDKKEEEAGKKAAAKGGKKK